MHGSHDFGPIVPFDDRDPIPDGGGILGRAKISQPHTRCEAT
jgi:hypothetical protein